MKISVLIPAGGTSSRFKTKGNFVSKLLEPLAGKSVLSHSISAFRQVSEIKEIIIASHPKLKVSLNQLVRELKLKFPVKIVNGGKTRAESVLNALRKTSAQTTHVMVHDGARPLLETEWVKSLIRNLNGTDGAVLGRMAVPTIKRISWSTGSKSGRVLSDKPGTFRTGTHLVEIEETLNRKELFEAETPQFFKKNVLLNAYKQLGKRAFEATDDASLVEMIGGSVKPVLHEGSNLKITTKEDLMIAQNLKSAGTSIRFGLGFDKHRLVAGRPFYLGGVKVPSKFGPLGHSDGDPLLHSIVDGMLGALGLGDIGDFFPDTAKRFKNISSTILLREAEKLISAKGFQVSQIDATIFLEAPKLGSYKKKIQSHLAKLLGIDSSKVGIKAKTAEGLGAEGRSEAVSAQALVVLNSKEMS